MRRAFVLLCVVAALCAAPAGTLAEPEDLAARGKTVESEFVEALVALAKWCNGRKLFGQRDDVYALILEFQPDHPKARRGLKYKRDGAGTWVQDPKYKRPKDWTPKLYEEFDRRRDEALHAYRDGMLAVCRSAATGPGYTWTASTCEALLERFPRDAKVLEVLRSALLRHLALLQKAKLPTELEAVSARLLKHFPEDEEVRLALGEVKHEGRWVTPATAKAAKSRARYRDVAEAAHNGVPHPERGSLTRNEFNTGLLWKDPFTTPHMRVLGTTTDSSLNQIASSCEAAATFFQSVFRKEPVRAEVYTFYVFARRQDWMTFIEGWAPFPPARQKEARTTRQSGFGIGPSTYAAFPLGTPEAERDLCVDVTFQHLLQMTFNPVPHRNRGDWRPMPAWVRIGVSDYLTYRLIGTRILTTVAGEYGRPLKDAGGRVPDKDTAWLKEALAILRRDTAKGTHLMLGKSIGAFGRDDAVTSFAFASWLLEGRPGQATAVLTEIGRRRPIKEVALEVMGLTIEALHVQMVRWLEEMTSSG
jgi:hypothetical protein